MALYTVVIDPRTGRPRKVRGTDPVTLQPKKRVARLSRTAKQQALLAASFQRQQAAMMQNCPRPANGLGQSPHHILGFLGGLFK